MPGNPQPSVVLQRAIQLLPGPSRKTRTEHKKMQDSLFKMNLVPSIKQKQLLYIYLDNDRHKRPTFSWLTLYVKRTLYFKLHSTMAFYTISQKC